MVSRGADVRCARCDNKGWFQNGNRRFRCVVCPRADKKVTSGGKLKLGRGELELDMPAVDYVSGHHPRTFQLPKELCRAKDDGVPCDGTTTFNKPYCLKHIFRLAYPRKVQEQVQAGEDELEVAASAGRARTPKKRDQFQVDPRGVKAREIATTLHRLGPRTPKRLAIEVEIVRPGRPHSENRDGQLQLWSFLVAMKKVGLVRVIEVGSIRGGSKLMVELTDEGRAFSEDTLRSV